MSDEIATAATAYCLAVEQASEAFLAGETQRGNEALARAKAADDALAAAGATIFEAGPRGQVVNEERAKEYERALQMTFEPSLEAEPLFRTEALDRATRAKEAMTAAEVAMLEAMCDAMEASASYEEIGRAVGMTKQAAHYRVHKFLGEDSGYVGTAAERVPVGARIAKRTGGKRRTLVADKRVGRANVTFYDAKDNAFLEVPIGTTITYIPPVDAMPLGRA